MTAMIGPPAAPIPVTVLGATGLVGQRMIALLDGHPWFRVARVAASGRSAGKPYAEAVRWRLAGDVPAAVRGLAVTSPEPGRDESRQVVLSALPASEAEGLEPAWAAAGAVVLSNASAHRMAPDVPLIVPEINPDHLAALEGQRRVRGWRGALVTNPNCSTIGLTLALAPLRRFGLRRVLVTTLQAASGAGHPGVPSLDLIDNVIPYIPGEEEKLETETRKILGGWRDGEGFTVLGEDALRIGAQCTRVPVSDGHLETISVEFAEHVTPEEVIAAWSDFAGEPQRLNLPTAPARPIVYLTGDDRPQPVRDRMAGNGMVVTVGRLRPCPVFDLRFVCLSHNTIRGAAGAAVLNAELAYATGVLG